MPHLNPPHVLPTDLLEEVENLLMAARKTASGLIAGMHRSLHRGTSVEFNEHKIYSPGDDLRHIDWRAYAKSDRFHIKQFEDETNLRIELLLDHSGSMNFQSHNLATKWEYTRNVAAAIAYLTLRQGDATGLITFSEKITAEVAPRANSSHLYQLLTQLSQTCPEGRTGVSDCLEQFAQSRRKQSLAIVISDLFDASTDMLSHFRNLVAARHEVVLLHILDPYEIDFPYENPSNFASMEDNRTLFVHPRILKKTYQKKMQAFLEQIQNTMRSYGIDYYLVKTNAPPRDTLAHILRSRASKHH